MAINAKINFARLFFSNGLLFPVGYTPQQKIPGLVINLSNDCRKIHLSLSCNAGVYFVKLPSFRAKFKEHKLHINFYVDNSNFNVF